MLEKRDADLARKGLQQGLLPNAPPPKQSEANAILVRFGRNPSAILAPGSKTKVKDCAMF